MPLPFRLPELMLLALPAGGQRTARRNAWAAMTADAARARARREAELAMTRAATLAATRAGTGVGRPTERTGT